MYDTEKLMEIVFYGVTVTSFIAELNAFSFNPISSLLLVKDVENFCQIKKLLQINICHKW